MTPFYTDPLVTLYLGDCLDVMRELPDASVDSVVTDPPYNLAFMGREWDKNLNHGPWATEAFRVLKPGGYLLAFGGTRTVHRLASAIEDAGFEIRDTLMWVYASGFPKSLDVSKALDKVREERHAEALTVTTAVEAAMRAKGMTRRDLNREVLGVDWHGGSAQSWTTTKPDGAHKPRVPEWGYWLKLKALLGIGDEMDAEVWRLNGMKGKPGEAWDQREVTGTRSRKGKPPQFMWEETAGQNWNETKAATDLARKWEGWGTALKPAHEPIVMARKPLVGSVAQNVTRYGTGALNIDGSRIGPPMTDAEIARSGKSTNGSIYGGFTTPVDWKRDDRTPQGRWPSNVLLDPEHPELFDEPNPYVVGSGANPHGAGFARTGGADTHPDDPGMFGLGGHETNGTRYGDSGGYSRFFIIPKADRAERERGLADWPKREGGSMAGGQETREKHGVVRPARANTHPTVKSLDLMRHLVRLVTPPGGTCLDPFLGSGTTALAASELGIKCIGIEREAEYLEIAKGRLMATPMGLGLDVPAPTQSRGPSPKGPGWKGHRATDGSLDFMTRALPDEEPAA